MDWVKQVQVICGSYCGVNLLHGMCEEDNSGAWVGGLFCTFLCVSPHLFVVMVLTALIESKLQR